MTELLILVAVVGRNLTTSGERIAVRLTFPRSTEAAQVIAGLRSLTGLLPPWWRRWLGTPSVALEARATRAGIEHVLTASPTRQDQVIGALRAAIPGLRVAALEAREGPPLTLGRELVKTGTGGDLRTDASAETNANLLAALEPLRRGEALVLQYVIQPVGRSLVAALRDRLNPPPTRTGRRHPDEPRLGVSVRAGVAATSERAAGLAARLVGAFHPLGTDEARLTRRWIPSFLVAHRISQQAPADRWTPALAADEVAALCAIPVGGPDLPGLTLAGSRELVAVSAVPRGGLVLGDSTVAGARRPVAVSLAEARRAVHVCAPTGAGKSTVLINLALQLMEAGQGVVVIDSKGDLISDLCDRIPESRRRDVVVFDPADTTQPVGFNLIGGGEAELIVDHVVGQLRSRYGAAGLGPRSEDILRASLLTLAREPGMTLCEVEPLLANASFRTRLIAGLNDPVLEAFWAWFSSLSEPARAEAIAPLANKLRTYTLRPRVRAVIGQSDGLDLARVLADGKVLLVSLAKGLVGEDASALLGAAMTARLWTVIQGRAGVPAERRRPSTVICDEFQDFARLPLTFGDAIAQSRGYSVSWVLAHQHLAQLDTPTRNAVLANCRTRLVMQTTASDAATFAREFAPHLTAADLQGLGPFEGYAAVSTGGAVAPPASIRTRPAPPSLGSAVAVRARSRDRYGTPALETEATIRRRVIGSRGHAPVGGVRRAR